MPAYGEVEVHTLQDDFSRGLMTRVSALGLKKGTAPPFLKRVANVLFRPARAFSVRPGFHDSSAGVLTELPTSLGKYYHSSGNKAYVATDDGSSSGKLFRFTATAYTAQTLPFTPSAEWWSFEMANGMLVGCQRAGSSVPCFYSPTNAADTWLTMTLPKPASAVTFNADSSGGNLVTAKTYYYRLRYEYANGSSKCGAVSAGRTVTTPNLTINLVIPLPVSSRTDYVGWILERTMQNGDATGPFYVVKSGTAGTTSDGGADADLDYETDETIHGEPVAMDGVIFHKGRLFGWKDSSLYCSQTIMDQEATGLCNWCADRIYPIGKDDGDEIQAVVIQGDRLLIGKRRSVWTLEGDDFDSFRLSLRYEGAGFAGPRAAAPLGSTVFFAAGDKRFFVVRGNAIEPLAAQEVGDYLELMDTTRDDEIVALNHLGDLVLFWYVQTPKTYADDILVYDLRFGNWTHFADMPAVAAMVQKDKTDFGGATLLFADPRVMPPSSSGGASTNPSFAVWLDKRSATNWQVYVQKTDCLGVPQWTSGGVQVSASTGTFGGYDTRVGAFVVPDGAGGCIVLWNDGRNGHTADVYAQRLNASGVAQWTAGGILLESSTDSSRVSNILAVASDRAGGAIYVFTDSTFTDSTPHLTVQRINSSGAKQWGGGTVLDTVVGGYGQMFDRVTVLVGSDSSSLVAYEYAWLDLSGARTNTGKVQRVTAAGAAAWTGPTSLGQISDTEHGSLVACKDDVGGVILAYHKGAGPDVYAQRINSSGVKLWATNGVLMNDTTAASFPVLVRDGDSGAVVSWRQYIGGTYGVCARRVAAAGAVAWAGVSLSVADGASSIPQELRGAEDGNGGMLVAWDYSGDATDNGVDAAWVTHGGAVPWGGKVRLDAGAKAREIRVATDGAGGLLVAWTGEPTAGAANRNIYLQRVGATGTAKWTVGGVAACAASLEQALRSICFTDTPEAEYPPGLTSGRHIWCGLKGTTDAADVNGAGGSVIRWTIKAHAYDDGLPDRDKEYQFFELYVNRGKGTVVATIEVEGSGVATLTLTVSASNPKYNTGLKYDTGVKYGTVGQAKAGTGLNPGLIGRSAAVGLTATVSDAFEVGGWSTDALALPRKEFS